MGASSTVENYLKAIYQGAARLPAEQRLLPMGQLAGALGVTPGTATAMVKTLADSGLVEYEPYSGVALTPAGRKLAALVLRRHRLIELFLVKVMGLGWDEVHEDAEQLEHAVSDRLVDRMDEMLGRPEADPHGDPIPGPDGIVKPQEVQTLLTCPLHTPVTVTRVIDQDKAFLRFLARHDLRPGAAIEIEARDTAGDSVRLKAEGSRVITIGTRAASKLLVQVAHALAWLAVLVVGASAQPAPPAGGPSPVFGILDNAFLVEEAFNQEPDIFQNIVTMDAGRDGSWEAAFTQEWPLGGWRHQVSYTVPFGAAGEGGGLGDIQLHYRWQARAESREGPAISPRLTVVLPSGVGTRGGRAAWQVNVPVSKQFGDAYVHGNAGFTHEPGEAGVFTPHAAGGLTWRAQPMFHPMIEAIVEIEDRATGRAAVWTLAPGFRTGWNTGATQTVIGFAVPLTLDAGAVDAGGFVYLSYERPFR